MQHQTYFGYCAGKTKSGRACRRMRVMANGRCKFHGGTTPADPKKYKGRAKYVYEKRMRRHRDSPKLRRLLNKLRKRRALQAQQQPAQTTTHDSADAS